MDGCKQYWTAGSLDGEVDRLMSTGVIGFLLLMAVYGGDGGISMMPLILATCAVGRSLYFWQAAAYRVDIYENGLEILAGY